MNETTPLIEEIRILRNLTVNSFSALRADLLSTNSFDEQMLNQINNVIYKIKSRCDSLKVFLQTVPNGDSTDGAIALAESIISHTAMLNSYLESSSVANEAVEFEHVFDDFFSELLRVFEEDKPPIYTQTKKASMRLASQLKKVMPSPIAFFFSVKSAHFFSSRIEIHHQDALTKIVREISFPPEYQQAGLSILNYFSVILNDKYPDTPVTVSIQQAKDKVTLIVTLPDGSVDKISKELNDYGLVITGKISPLEFAGSELKALALQQKLELAQLEVRQTRDLLRLQEQYSDKRINSLELEIKNLYSIIGRELTSKDALQEALIHLATQMSTGYMSEQAAILMQSLASAIGEQNTERTRIVLDDIRTSQPGLFAQLNDFFLQAATSGVIGNYVYEWLKAIWPILPK